MDENDHLHFLIIIIMLSGCANLLRKDCDRLLTDAAAVSHNRHGASLPTTQAWHGTRVLYIAYPISLKTT